MSDHPDVAGMPKMCDPHSLRNGRWRVRLALAILLALGAAGLTTPAFGVVHVDDDAPGDPAPNDPTVGDPLEDGTAAHPFDSIQEAIDLGRFPCELSVKPGTYHETLDMFVQGCSIIGSGSMSTLIEGVGGVVLSAQILPNPPTSQGLRLQDLTLKGGRLDVYVGAGLDPAREPPVGVDRVGFVDAQFQVTADGASGVRLRSTDLVDSSVGIKSDYEGVMRVVVESMSISGAGGIGFWAINDSRLVAEISDLVGPSAGIGANRAVGGHVHLLLRDSVIGALGSRTQYSFTGRVENVVFTGIGVLTGNSGEGVLDLEFSNCIFESGGIEILSCSDGDAPNVAGIKVSGSLFKAHGVHIASDFGSGLSNGVFATLEVDGCTFEQDGVSADTRYRDDPYSTGGFVDILLTNNVFKSAPIGFEMALNLSNLLGAPADAHFNTSVINNTFADNDTGIRIVTSPHASGTATATTTIRNNIVTGGSTGIEILGTTDQTFILEGNDVWGNNERNWVGDVANPTGQDGNISANPFFVAGGADAYGLSHDSPCVDGGVPGPGVPGADHAGTQRPQDGDSDGVAIVDIGAFEMPPDADADGVDALSDCDESNPEAWSAPGEVGDVDLLVTGDMITWSAPGFSGGASPRYDTLRSSEAGDFMVGATCAEVDDPTDTQALDTGTPLVGSIYFYLVRAENACPGEAGSGSLGKRSDGTLRTGRACP